MTKRIEKSLQGLREPLRERLDRVLAHLRAARWKDRDALCYAGTSNAEVVPLPGTWAGPGRSELDQMRFDGYTWSLERIRAHSDEPITIAEALDRIERTADELVDTTIAIMGVCLVGLVGKEFQSAVLNRDRLIEDWPWPLEAELGGALVHLLISLCPSLPPDEQLIAAWPADAAVATVADWARPWLRQNAHLVINGNVSDVDDVTGVADVVEIMKQTQRNAPTVFSLGPGLPSSWLPSPALALLYVLERDVEEKRGRKFIAIDTCKEHTKLVESWRDLPKSRKAKISSTLRNNRLELIVPSEEEKRHFQLSLALTDETVAAQVARVLREWRGWIGLRHWVAFQSMITGNRRLGWTRWTVDDHLATMGYRKERARRLELRRAAAEMIVLFTRIEMAIYDDKGKLRERRPLVLKGNTYERLEGSEWEIEGLELKINPLLYRGVRDPGTGKLGKNWWPTPRELAHIDHEKYGPAIAFGTILPGRWRMELSSSDRVYVDLTGESLLRAGGLPYRQRNVVATWRSVERNLGELQRRGGIERWEWLGEPGLTTLCRLYAPSWAVDRVVHGVPPRETVPLSKALTGAELRAWRKKTNLTQLEMAERLGVSPRTIERAESRHDKPLTKRVREALKRTEAPILRGPTPRSL